jgi:tetratricopeptide (TPR) repeat protein
MLFFGKKEKTFQDAMVCYSKKNYKQTVSICENIVSSHPNSFEVMNLLGDAYFYMGKHDKTLEAYDNLLKKYENGNYLDKAIALVKKIIRNYPEKSGYSERLADLFGKKQLMREQISILANLLENARRRGLMQETNKIIYLLLAIKTTNSSDTIEILRLVSESGQDSDVHKVLERGFHLKKINPEHLVLLVDTAVKRNMDFEMYIRSIPEYVAAAPGKVGNVADACVAYLDRKYNKEFFASIASVADPVDLMPILIRLKRKYPTLEIYEPLLRNALAEGQMDAFENYMAEIAALSDSGIDYNYAKMAASFIEQVQVPSVLEKVLVIVTKAHALDLRPIVLDTLREAYEKAGDLDRAQEIADELYGKKARLKGGDKEADTIAIDNFETVDDPDVQDILEDSLMSVTSKKKPAAKQEPLLETFDTQEDEPEQFEKIELDNFGYSEMEKSAEEEVPAQPVDLDSFGGETSGEDVLDMLGVSEPEQASELVSVEVHEMELDDFAVEEETEHDPGIPVLKMDDDFDEDEIFSEVKSEMDEMFGDLEPAEEEEPETAAESDLELRIDDLSFDAAEEEEKTEEKNQGTKTVDLDDLFGGDEKK